MIDDADSLRRALAGRREPPDPEDLVAPVTRQPLPTGWLDARKVGLRHAAILVPFIDTGDALDVLLTERAQHLKHHPGQVSFPGGAVEPGDASLADAALREAKEEVGLAPERVDVIGFLRPQWTVSGYAMTPVIGLVNGPVEPVIDPAEVASAFTVPAAHLFDPATHRRGERDYQGTSVEVIEILWRRYRIWGATASVIDRLYNIIKNNE